MAIVKKISELTPKGSNLGTTDLLIVGVDNGTDYDLKSVTGAQLLGTVVSQTITDGVTSKSPSENSVFDALSLKVDKVTGSRLITTVEGTILSNTSGTNTGDQTLQTVTNLGSITTNSISSQTASFQSTVSPSQIQTQTLANSKRSALNSEGSISLSTTGTSEAKIKATNIVNDVILEVPNKSIGSYTIATTTDLTSKVDSNTAITGATKTKITYDSKGLVTSGTDATTEDISDSLNKRYVTDANLTVIGNTSGTNTGDQDLSNLATKSNPTFTGLTTLDTLKVTTGNYITPVDVVGIDVTGNVNRVSAVNGRTALGLGTLATQNGTFSGTSSGTNTGDQDLSTYQPYTTATIGSVISFIVPQVYNSVASPSSSNITDSLTSAKIGVVQKIYHNHTVAPTFPAGWVKMGTATYTTSTLNVIFAEWVSSTRVEYWITKPS